MLRFARFALFIIPTLFAWGPFAALMWADKNVRNPVLRGLIWIPGGFFYALDVVFNCTIGSLVWWEVPPDREALYTDRLKRKVREGAVGADWQASILNKLDPGHV